MKSQKSQKLPAQALYRRNCHDSDKQFLCYLSSTTQIQVVQFDSSNKIKSSYTLNIPLQPVRGIKIMVKTSKHNSNQKLVYICATTISRLLIFCNTEVYYQSSLKLDCNIVSFTKGYISPVKFNINQEVYGFILSTIIGQVTIFYIPNKNRVLKSPQKAIDSCVSMAVMYPYLYFGDDYGKIQLHQITDEEQHYKMIKSYDTKSELPILNILVIEEDKSVIFTTCQGEILIATQKLEMVSLISVHHSAISRIIYNPQTQFLLSSGEDGWLHQFATQKQPRRLTLKNSQYYSKIINLMYIVNNKHNMIGFYEESKFIKV